MPDLHIDEVAEWSCEAMGTVSIDYNTDYARRLRWGDVDINIPRPIPRPVLGGTDQTEHDELTKLFSGKKARYISLMMTTEKRLVVQSLLHQTTIMFVIDTINGTIIANKERTKHLELLLKEYARVAGLDLHLINLMPRGGKGTTVLYWSFAINVDDASLLQTKVRDNVDEECDAF